MKQHQAFLEKEKQRKEDLGEVRPIIHIDYNGYKIVAVGSSIYFSKEWKTFTDFLFTNNPHHFGDDRLPDPNKNIIATWSKNPKYAASDPNLLNRLFHATLQYGNIPSLFPNI